MPLVHPTHVVSFSSEDPNHPVSNLLNRDTFRKWKCKDPGEKEAFVILKFDKAEAFSCIDVGNDGSALVEVSVARSGNGEPQFEVLLVSTAFMSPLDSREGKNLNGVKSFSANSLSKPIVAQKWDLVKVSISQPFNRHVQYGLTFVKFTAVPDPNEPEKIGMFGFRKPIGGVDSDDEDNLKPGLLFNTALKSPAGNASKPNGSISTTAAIRDASSRLLDASKSPTEEKVKELLHKRKMDLPSPSTSSPGGRNRDNSTSSKGSNDSPLPNRKQLPDLPIKSVDKKGNQSPSSVARSQKSTPSSTADTNKAGKKRTLSPDPQQTNAVPKPSTSQGTTPSKKQKKTRKTKPFDKLFEGVVFVISGYENPFRGQIRDKGVQMGGRYKADWDRTCTHLICAFVNTPKFRQVRGTGHGEIVKKEWIEKSYDDRIRYPWRRYCLDRNDRGAESEEEIHAENGENEEVLDEEQMETNTEEDEEVNTKTKRKRVQVLESSDEAENSNDSKAAYDADTDIDEDKTPDLSPSLMDSAEPSDEFTPFFENLEFFICPLIQPPDDSQETIEKLENIILKHKGRIHKSSAESIEYFVCQTFDWDEDFSDALSDNPNLTFIHKNWIFECDKADKLVGKDPFILSPN